MTVEDAGKDRLEPSDDGSKGRTWGACGVENCDECWPIYNEANVPITGNFGEPL